MGFPTWLKGSFRKRGKSALPHKANTAYAQGRPRHFSTQLFTMRIADDVKKQKNVCGQVTFISANAVEIQEKCVSLQ